MKHQPNEDIIRLFAGNSNGYLIRWNKTALLIDTGMKTSKNTVLRTICKHGLNPGDISLIVLTHTHYDHCGNVKTLKDITGAHVVVHSHEADNLRKGFTPLPKGTNVFSRFLSFLGRNLGKRMARYEAVEPDITVENKFDLTPYNIPGYILPTPGHTSGSLSVVLDDRHAFIGDTAFNIAGTGIFPPFANDPKEVLHSWEKLLDTGCEYFYPGHGRVISKARFQMELNKKK